MPATPLATTDGGRPTDRQQIVRVLALDVVGILAFAVFATWFAPREPLSAYGPVEWATVLIAAAIALGPLAAGAYLLVQHIRTTPQTAD